MVAAPASADVDDFTFTSFDGQYYLGTDPEGHSTLRTVETLVAKFPEFDQNRGIRRVLVDRYDGHPTDLEIVAVSDENGTPRGYELETEDGNVVLTIADDDYVHGENTYSIEYTQRHVTRYFADTDADEFYWDTNGTDWGQPFESVTATVHLEEQLERALNGNVTAVWGYQGEARPATIDGLTFSASNLAAGQNLTFAIGFEPGTFVPRASGFFDSAWPPLALVFSLLALGVTAVAWFVRATRLRDAAGRGIIVPEYLPPKNANIQLSALIAGKTAKLTSAQIIAFAVAHRLRVIEVAGKKAFGKARYRLEFVTAEGVDADEREFLHALFGNTLTPGEYRDLKSSDSKAVARLSKLQTTVAKNSVASGHRRKTPTGLIALVLTAGAIATVAAVVFGAIALDQAYGGLWPVLLIVVAVLALVADLLLLLRTPLDEKGVELRDYLKGLEMYITLAEADRIRYLQSPQGALREPVSTIDTGQLVKLNERLLPYAMLFGHEKEWAEELGRYYEQLGTQPDWYVGHGAFNAALFASSIGSVAASTASAYSSSSGGSSGGASSGGGGGGGGGGGV